MHYKAIETGDIYILQNPCFAADILKIGKTTKCAYDRARQLSRESSVPEDFIVAYSRGVWDIAQPEDNIFLRLDQFRPHRRKEFFRVPLETAIAVAEKVIVDINSQSRETVPGRHRRWEDFEREMRERDEAMQQYYEWKDMLKESYPEQAAWMFPDEEA